MPLLQGRANLSPCAAARFPAGSMFICLQPPALERLLGLIVPG